MIVVFFLIHFNLLKKISFCLSLLKINNNNNNDNDDNIS